MPVIETLIVFVFNLKKTKRNGTISTIGDFMILKIHIQSMNFDYWMILSIWIHPWSFDINHWNWILPINWWCTWYIKMIHLYNRLVICLCVSKKSLFEQLKLSKYICFSKKKDLFLNISVIQVVPLHRNVCQYLIFNILIQISI